MVLQVLSCTCRTYLNLVHLYLSLHTQHKQRSSTAVCVHSQAERQQRQQGLLGGAGSKLWQCLDQFVHHHAQVALQLLPPLLHKLGILQTEEAEEAEERVKKDSHSTTLHL